MLMDRSERRLVMVRSLGELLPLRTYNTEYGNILCRVSKHKARLANMIEVDVASDEAPPSRDQPAGTITPALTRTPTPSRWTGTRR